MSVIEIIDIMDYVGHGKRPFVEGSEILKCNHIIEYGIKEQTENKLVIIALCLQTSNINSHPHEVLITKTVHEGNVKLSGSCSCKAGTGKCKHVVGVMLKLQKTSIDCLEELSCTELRQQWGKLKTVGTQMYQTIPVKKFCHVQNYVSPYSQTLPDSLPNDIEKIVYETLLKDFPDSAIGVHMKGRHEPRVIDAPCCDIDFVKKLLTSCHEILNEFNNINKYEEICSKNAISFYYSVVKIDKDKSLKIISDTLCQNGNLWLKVRQLRITATSAYSLYTFYNGKNGVIAEAWLNKLETIVFSSFSGNLATKFGKKYEDKARKAFERIKQIEIKTFGFIINDHCPWLGFSPDGFYKCGNNIILVEIKCPVAGKLKSGINLIKMLKYLLIDEVTGEIKLKKTHQYYGQIQLGLLLTNLSKCVLIIYEQINDSVLLIDVEFDHEYCTNMYQTLTCVYFNHYLPFLVRHQDRLIKI